MDQLLTLLLLLGITLSLAIGLRRPVTSSGVSVNWDMSGVAPAETPRSRSFKAGKGLAALLLLAGALAFALITSAAAARPAHQAAVSPYCVNWNGCPRSTQGAQPVLPAASVSPYCVNWNGCPRSGTEGALPVIQVAGTEPDCVNWNG